MVFLAERTIPIPEKDILSWIFDEVPYNQDQPVSTYILLFSGTKDLECPLGHD